VSTLSEQSTAHDTAKEDEAAESDTNQENSRSNNVASKKRGRPKGTTKKGILAAKREKQMALNHAALEASELKETANDTGERVPKSTYRKIIEETEKKIELEEGSISRSALLTWSKKNRKVVAAGRGNISPLIGIEAHFVDIILQLSAMCQPLSASSALSVINSLVDNCNMQKEIIHWKKKCLPDDVVDNEAEKGSEKKLAHLRKAYWKNFKKRHPELKTKWAVRFDSKREDWCNYENFKTMYNGVYAAMVQSRVAIKLEDEVMVKLDGSITSNAEEQVGRKTKYILTHPKFVFFVDEVGCNTSQKIVGNNGGQKFIVQDTQRALLRSSYNDCHFTVLGFMNGTNISLRNNVKII